MRKISVDADIYIPIITKSFRNIQQDENDLLIKI